MTDIKDLLRDELIGLEVEIVDSANPSDIGAKGAIIDETKHTLTIADGRRRRYWKKNITIRTAYKGRTVRIECRLLVGRPHERIKR